jgi:hypothetical protein
VNINCYRKKNELAIAYINNLLQDYYSMTPISEHDLSVFKNISGEIFNQDIFADKAYHDVEFSKDIWAIFK